MVNIHWFRHCREGTKFQAVWLTMLIQWELSNHNCNIDFYAKWQMKGLEFRWQLKLPNKNILSRPSRLIDRPEFFELLPFKTNISVREWLYVNEESDPRRKIVLHLLKSWKRFFFQKCFCSSFHSYGIPNLRTSMESNSIRKLGNIYLLLQTVLLIEIYHYSRSALTKL